MREIMIYEYITGWGLNFETKLPREIYFREGGAVHRFHCPLCAEIIESEPHVMPRFIPGYGYVGYGEGMMITNCDIGGRFLKKVMAHLIEVHKAKRKIDGMKGKEWGKWDFETVILDE